MVMERQTGMEKSNPDPEAKDDIADSNGLAASA